jgi:hypothetical protein
MAQPQQATQPSDLDGVLNQAAMTMAPPSDAPGAPSSIDDALDQAAVESAGPPPPHEEQGTIAVPSAGRIPGVFMPAPKVTPEHAVEGVAAGAGAGALAAGGAMVPGVLTGAIATVKAIGRWAKDNPVKAWLAYQALDEAGITKPIKNLPGGGVIPFLLLLHGKNPGMAAEAEGAAGAETEAAAAETKAAGSETTQPESATDFIKRQTPGRVMQAPNAEGKAVDLGTEEEVESEGEPQHLTLEARQKASDRYYEEHPEKRPQPKIIQRGAMKGQVKTQRVFHDGKWTEVPVYK